MFRVNIPLFSSILCSFTLSKIFKQIPLFPSNIIKSLKPILVIDPSKTLLSYKFSFWKFDYIFTPRMYTEEFLFNLGCLYDIFFITDDETITSRVYDLIDPLGISTYRLCTSNKDEEIKKIKDINQVVVLENKPSEEEGHLNIQSFNNSKYELLDVVNFLSTINFINIKNINKTLSTYRNKDFYSAFDKVQRKIYKMRHMINLFSGDKYEKIKQQIYDEKIRNYKMNKEELIRYRK